jgi:hypothetical protein
MTIAVTALSDAGPLLEQRGDQAGREPVRDAEARDADGGTVPDVRHRRGGRSHQLVHSLTSPITSLLLGVADGKPIGRRKAAIVPVRHVRVSAVCGLRQEQRAEVGEVGGQDRARVC